MILLFLMHRGLDFQPMFEVCKAIVRQILSRYIAKQYKLKAFRASSIVIACLCTKPEDIGSSELQTGFALRFNAARRAPEVVADRDRVNIVVAGDPTDLYSHSE